MTGAVATDWAAAARPGARVGHTIEEHASIGSTNDRARALLDAGDRDGVAVVAELQTAGRGRMGRSWTSPAAVNLTVSIGLRPRIAVDEAWAIGPAAALAARTACSLAGEVWLKWPNDLVDAAGRKAGGLLVEAASEADRLRHAVVGVGINVNWRASDMPAELRQAATSLRELAGHPVDRVEVLARLLAALEDEVEALEAGRSPLNRYRRACRTLGADVVVETPGGAVRGRAVDLDERGALIVETGAGTVTVASGEVTRVRPSGGDG